MARHALAALHLGGCSRNFLLEAPSADPGTVLNPKQVRNNSGQETKARFNRLSSSVTRNIPQAANVPFLGGGIQWKRFGKTSSFAGSNDAQEPRFHDRGGALSDARNWSHHRNLHGRECRAAAAAALRATRTTHSNLYGISNLPEWRDSTASGLPGRSFWIFAGIPIPGPSLDSVDHRRSEPGGKNAAGARHGGVRERRTPGNAWRGRQSKGG